MGTNAWAVRVRQRFSRFSSVPMSRLLERAVVIVLLLCVTLILTTWLLESIAGKSVHFFYILM